MAAMSLGSAAKSAVLEACRFGGINSFAHKKTRGHLLVLCYHGVVSQPQKDRFRYVNTVSVAEFEAHLSTLAKDFNPVTVSDVIAWYNGGKLPEHPVLVTFDDGYRNNLTLAAPILKAHRVPCVFHITTEYIGSDRTLWTDEVVSRILDWPNAAVPLPEGGEGPLPTGEGRRTAATQIKEACKRMPWQQTQMYLEKLRSAGRPLPENRELYQFLTWDEVRELHNQGFEIGSHTVDHPILTQIPPEQLAAQLAQSKARIESELGAPCRVIAYPNGSRRDFSATVEQAAREAGYQLALTIVEDFNETPANAMAVNRLCIMGHLPVSSFLFRVNGTYRLAR